MNNSKLPTQALVNFIDKVKHDSSDESISSGLQALAECELDSLRNFINAIEIHLSDRVHQIDIELDRQLEKELKQAHLKKYLSGA